MRRAVWLASVVSVLAVFAPAALPQLTDQVPLVLLALVVGAITGHGMSKYRPAYAYNKKK